MLNFDLISFEKRFYHFWVGGSVGFDGFVGYYFYFWMV
jgi:hypothetical protein